MLKFFAHEISATFGQLGRIRLAVAFGISFAMFWGICHLLNIPTERSLQGSLLCQSGAIGLLLLTVVLLVISALIGRFIVASTAPGENSREMAGIFVACLGMTALSIRCGPVNQVLYTHPTPGVFITMAVESVLLFLLVALSFVGSQILSAVPETQVALKSGDEPGSIDEPANLVITIGVQAVVMLSAMMFLSQADAKKQALAAAGIAAFLGTLAAYFTFPVRRNICYLAGPLLVALVGYIAAFANPAGQAIGFPDGPLGPLARAVPLDYASAGIAGAILGYWVAYNLAHPVETDQTASVAQTA